MRKQIHAFTIGIALVSALASTEALAAGVVLETPIGYANGAAVPERIRTECRVPDDLEAAISANLDKVNRKKGVNSAADPTLRVEITYILGAGGGAWSGPKAITVHATLMENGKVLREGKVNRWSSGGFWGGFKGTCSILARDAKAIGKDLGRWVKDANYALPDEAEPPAEAASAPAEDKAK